MKEQIKKICKKIIEEKDKEKALYLIKELKKIIEEYEAKLINEKNLRRFIVIKDVIFPYDTALLTLIYMTLYKHMDKNNTVKISYNKIADSINIGETTVSSKMKLLIKIKAIKKTGLSKNHINIYKVEKLFSENLKASDIITNIHEFANISPLYFKCFKKTIGLINEKIREKIDKYTHPVPKGLISIEGVLIPHTILRPILVFIAIYLHKDKEGITYISNRTLTAYIGIGNDTLKKDIALLSSRKWIEIIGKKTVGTYKVLKQVEALEIIYKNTAVLNIRELYTTSPSKDYAKVIIKLSEELSGLSLNKIKEGKND